MKFLYIFVPQLIVIPEGSLQSQDFSFDEVDLVNKSEFADYDLSKESF